MIRSKTVSETKRVKHGLRVKINFKEVDRLIPLKRNERWALMLLCNLLNMCCVRGKIVNPTFTLKQLEACWEKTQDDFHALDGNYKQLVPKRDINYQMLSIRYKDGAYTIRPNPNMLFVYSLPVHDYKSIPEWVKKPHVELGLDNIYRKGLDPTSIYEVGRIMRTPGPYRYEYTVDAFDGKLGRSQHHHLLGKELKGQGILRSYIHAPDKKTFEMLPPQRKDSVVPEDEYGKIILKFEPEYYIHHYSTLVCESWLKRNRNLSETAKEATRKYIRTFCHNPPLTHDDVESLLPRMLQQTSLMEREN